MKNLIYVFSISLLLGSCTSENISTPEQSFLSENDYIEYAINTIDNQSELLYINNFISDGSQCINNFMESDEIIENIEIGINSNSSEGKVLIKAVTKKMSGNNSEFEVLYNVVNEAGYNQTFSIRLLKIGDNSFEISSIDTDICDLQNHGEILLQSRWCGWDCYTDCVMSVVDLPSVKILGIAGGVGCAGCGIAAAVIVGFGAIGCAG